MTTSSQIFALITALLVGASGLASHSAPAQCDACPPAETASAEKEKEGDADADVATAELPKGPPEDAVEFNGHFYKVFDVDDTEMTWHTKKELCEKMGGYLAVIETEEEQEFIAKLADQRYLSLGATDEEEEGTWKWINGAEWKEFGWMQDQPNNYGGEEHYLATYDDGEWVDVAVGGYDFWLPTGYICEWEPDEIDQPE